FFFFFFEQMKNAVKRKIGGKEMNRDRNACLFVCLFFVSIRIRAANASKIQLNPIAVNKFPPGLASAPTSVTTFASQSLQQHGNQQDGMLTQLGPSGWRTTTMTDLQGTLAPPPLAPPPPALFLPYLQAAKIQLAVQRFQMLRRQFAPNPHPSVPLQIPPPLQNRLNVSVNLPNIPITTMLHNGNNAEHSLNALDNTNGHIEAVLKSNPTTDVISQSNHNDTEKLTNTSSIAANDSKAKIFMAVEAISNAFFFWYTLRFFF
ncbi:hypothetical protein RFI_11676, partial [Reticulomyxa filosa]